ncbi:putative nepenthesin [Helianthus debilis subsp. tardiflorus]
MHLIWVPPPLYKWHAIPHLKHKVVTNTMMFSSLVVAITLTISYTTTSSVAIDDTSSVDLIHHDSVDSPFYDCSMSLAQRIGHALQRSFINAKQFRSNINRSTYQADAIPDHGEFLLNISYGNPSQKVLAITDTGSDLSWMQCKCKPCIKRYKHTAPLFDPKSSSTYQPIDCESKRARLWRRSQLIAQRRKNASFYRFTPTDRLARVLFQPKPSR